MKLVEFAPRARADLLEIDSYIAADDPDRAASFVRELRDHAIKIGERPSSFPARDAITPGLRSARHGRYLIFFRDLGEVVRIVRIIHGARDLMALARRGELD